MGQQSDAAVRDLERQAAKATQMLTLEIAANLRERTPKDTGHAAANWVPSVGVESTLISDGASTSVADQGAAAVLTFKLTDGACFVSNNVPYVPMLNLGHSKQAPVGFVEAAVADAQATVQSKFDGLKIELGASAFTNEAGGRAAVNLAQAYLPEGLP